MKKRVVGLTGGIGTGKTTAATILAELGAVVIDCDGLGREVAEVGGSAYESIVERFGRAILAEDGSIDRPALGAIVFNDSAALDDLNAITHPAIDGEIAKRIDSAPDDAVVVLDMAVLVESDLGKGLYEEVLVIETPPSVRLHRLVTERGMSEADAEARMASQASDEERRLVADFVLVNDSSVDQLRSSLTTWWRRARR